MRRTAPASLIVAFSASFDSAPEWGDAFVPKEDISQMVPTLEGLRRIA
jgi:hypothetical protein